MIRYACVQIPDVAIAVARRDDPALAGRPLLLYTTDRARPTVSAAAPESGVTAGIPLRQALLECPDAVCRPAAPARDRQVYGTLIALAESISPRVEPIALLPHATIVLDLGRIALPQTIALGQQLAECIQQAIGTRPALGVAATRFIAIRAASAAGQGRAIAIAPGQEARFLAPLPISLLPIDGAVARQLHLLGLRTLGAVAAVPLDAFQARFGMAGARIHRLARGMDEPGVEGWEAEAGDSGGEIGRRGETLARAALCRPAL